MTASGFDWPALLRCGLGGLRLPPEVFWNMTPAELQMMIGPAASAGPLPRARLERLMKAYPDIQTKEQTHDAR